jgi:hypothetical protein
MRTDTELLDALEALVNRGCCPGIINDDNGHWAVTGDGMQNVVCGDEPQDVQTTFFVEAAQWRKTIREAIEVFVNAADDDYDGNPDDLDGPEAQRRGI